MLHLYSSSGQLFHAIIRLLLLVLLLAVLFRPAQLSHLTLSLASSSVTLNLCTSFLTTNMNVCCGPPRFLLSHSCIFSILWPVYPLSLPCLPTVAQFPPLTCKPTAPEAVVVNLGSNQSNVEMSFFMIALAIVLHPYWHNPSHLSGLRTGTRSALACVQ